MARAITDRRILPGRVTAGLWLCVGLVLAALFVAAPAYAQRGELRPLFDRLDRLEREINLLQRQVYRGRVGTQTAPPAARPTGLSPKVAARMEVRIGELETELRNITGKIEELSFGLDKVQSRIEKLVGDVDVRLAAIEQSLAQMKTGQIVAGGPGQGPMGEGADAASSQSSSAGEKAGAVPAPPGEMTAALPVLPEGTPMEQYEHALSLLRQADYSGAESALRAFIATNPDHSLVENAQYWLGETYYVRNDYTNAAVVFAEGYEKFSDGVKAPDNLLKLGMSLANLNETEQACKVFAELGKKFPDAPVNIAEPAARVKKSIGCE